MVLSFLRIKASGLKKSPLLFVFINRLLKRPSKNLQKVFLSFTFLFFLGILFFFSDKENSYLETIHTRLGEFSAKILYYGQLPFAVIHHYCQTYRSLEKKIDVLTLENQRLHRLENQAVLDHRENQSLRKLAKVVEESQTETVTVRVLARPTDSANSLLVIEMKPELSFQKDQVVLSTEGVIGRIYKVGLTCAWVLLVTDSRSRIPARITSTGEDVILVGQNTPALTVLHTASPFRENLSSVKEGDLLITSGFGGIYPAGLPIARLSSEQGILKAIVLGESEEFVVVQKNIIPTEHASTP